MGFAQEVMNVISTDLATNNPIRQTGQILLPIKEIQVNKYFNGLAKVTQPSKPEPSFPDSQCFNHSEVLIGPL
jgi:hypothetical protein